MAKTLWSFGCSECSRVKIDENTSKPAVAAVHGPHNVYDIGHCTVVMPEVCSWLTNEKQIKTDIRSTDQ